MRSSAWICVFSSTHSTKACSGGLRYRPTTSTTFSIKCLSLLSLKVRHRCGFKPLLRQTRFTIARLVPNSLASVRQLQCVAFFGFLCVVHSMIRAVMAARFTAGRPPRGASFSIPARPLAQNLVRHLPTSKRSVPSFRAITLLATPAAACNTICARRTKRAGVLRPRDHCSNVFRCSSEMDRFGATRTVLSSSWRIRHARRD